jgi:hypothetical protein
VEPTGRGRLLVIGLIALGLGGAAFATWYRVRHEGVAGPRLEGRAVPGEHGRVVVEVLNATPAVGLARSATHRLRDAGLDVVYFGSDTSQALDSTEVLVRRGPAAAGEQVREALGTGRVRTAPDPSRLVDVTVRLGRDVAPLLRDP